VKAALIPPVEHLWDFAGDDQIHLLLSHLLDRPAYLDFYRKQHLRGAYLILDNGAHENTSGEPMQEILAKAVKVRASEVVLPDTLADYHATVKGAEQALIYLLGPGQDVWAGKYPALMLVPQGATRDDWERCFQDLVALYVKAQVARPDLFARSLTIGVSKDYDQWKGGHVALLEFLARFHEWMRFDIHLLGWARDLVTLGTLADTFPWIRSTDSARPFVYAASGIRLGRPGHAPLYPGRAPDYFDMTMDEDMLDCARSNVAYFRKMAHHGG
jgi:hypothetical protein